MGKYQDGTVVDLDLGALFQQAFGKETPAFNPQLAQVSGDTLLSRVETASLRGAPYYANDLKLGTEYFMPVTVTYPDQTSAADGLLNGDTTGILNKWNLPFPVISISSRKTLIETPLTERNGNVIELINIQGYVIKIRGFIISATDDFPEDDVTTMRNVYEINEAVNIKCPLTDIFLVRPERMGSDSVVLKSIVFPELKGVKNIKPYELELISDEIFNLIDIS